MPAGDLNRRVRIDRAIDVQDTTTGEAVTNWTTFAGPLWAAILPLRGNEAFIDGAIRADMATRIRLRYARALVALGPKHRIVDLFDGTIYNIVSAIDIATSHEYVEVMATSGLNEGQ